MRAEFLLTAASPRKKTVSLALVAGLALFSAGVPLYLSSIEQDLESRTLERARQLEPLVNGVSFAGQDGTIFCSSPVEYPAQLLRGLSALDGVHSVVADRSCRVLRAPTVDGSSTATIPSTTEIPQPTTTLGSIVRETTTTEALPVSNDELLLSVLESDPELTTMARLALTAGLESWLGDVVIVLAPVDGAFDEFGADLLAEIETDVASTIALVDMHVLESVDSPRIDTADDVTTIDGYAQVIEVLDVGDRQVWLLDSVLQADGTGVLPLLEIELTNSTLQIAGSHVSEEVLDAVTSIAEESGRTVERRFGSTSDNTMLDEAQVISLNAIERLLRAMIGSLETGVLTVADTGTSLAGSYLDENRAASLTAVAQSVGAEVSLAPPAPLGSAEIDALNDDIVELLISKPVSFISGSAEFVWGSDGVLDEIAQLLVDVPGISVVVRGHTDSDGVPESNVQLSTDRAAAVAAALIDGGLERLSVSWEGVGSAEPVIIEGVEDKELSRRVEIIVLAA